MLSVKFDKLFFTKSPLTTHNRGSFENRYISSISNCTRWKDTAWSCPNYRYFWLTHIILNISGSYSMHYIIWYLGRKEEKICKNNGRCIPALEALEPLCECQFGFSGQYCEQAAESFVLVLSLWGIVALALISSTSLFIYKCLKNDPSYSDAE